MVEEAQRSARGEGEQEEEEGEEIEVEEVEEEIIADDVNEAIDETETETEENITAAGISEPETLSSIQKACLTFCIALLS